MPANAAAITAAREGMEDLGERIDALTTTVRKRDDWFRKFAPLSVIVALGIIVALVYLGVGYHDNATAIREDKKDRIAQCRRGREDFQRAFEASADGLIDIAKSSPESQSPEDQARIESFRQPLRDSYVRELPAPEDCK